MKKKNCRGCIHEIGQIIICFGCGEGNNWQMYQKGETKTTKMNNRKFVNKLKDDAIRNIIKGG